jgi:hypothetical protein
LPRAAAGDKLIGSIETLFLDTAISANGHSQPGDVAMFRKLMSRLLGADLGPAVSWSEIESMKTVARISTEVSRGYSGKETMEQVLCDSGNGYVLFTRRLSSGMLTRISFGKQLNGREMRLAEWQPGPPAAY